MIVQTVFCLPLLEDFVLPLLPELLLLLSLLLPQPANTSAPAATSAANAANLDLII